MSNYITLNDIAPGEMAKIKSINICGSMKRRLLDIGLIEDTITECVGKSPMGDPKAFLIRGAVIAIRSDDSMKILVEKVSRL